MKNELTEKIAPQTDKELTNATDAGPLSSNYNNPDTVTAAENKSGRPVHTGLRVINFAIDMFIWFVLALISVILLDHYLPTVDHFTINALAYSAMAGLYLGYYFIFEYFFQKTLGKLLTRTKVVSLFGVKPTAKHTALRTLSRLIPVDFLFYFFSRNGLHDTLSNTQVVKSK